MDWRSVRFDWARVRAFLVSAEEGSFSAAARALGVSQPTIGRQVTGLEEELGVALFERVGHRLSLTNAGADLIEHAREMGEAATRFSRVAAGQALSIDGQISITASELIAAYLLPPILGRIRGEHPGIEIEIVASNQVRDLKRREADIAVRNVRPTQPDLIGKKIDDREAHLYAAPAYLERLEAELGGPVTAEGLGEADFFGFDRSEMMIKGLRAMGLPVGPQNFPIVTENHLVQWEMAKHGLGIAIVMSEVGDREPRVRRVLPELPPLPVPLWLAAHRELSTSRRVRVVFDMLAEGLAQSARCAQSPRKA